MQRVLPLLLVCFFSQTFVAKAQEDHRYWSDRKLEWTDFKGIPRRSGGSQLKYVQGYKTEKQKYHDTVVVRLVAYTYMDMNASWVNLDAKTQNLLRYNQTLFDLLELGRRRMQEGLDAAKSKNGIEDTFQYYTHRNDLLLDRLDDESGEGTDSVVVESWNAVVQEQLAEGKENAVPSLTLRNFKYGLHFSFGFTTFQGSLYSCIVPAPSLNYGFDLGYKRSLLILDVVLGGTRAKKDLHVAGNVWEKDKRLGYVKLNMALGYRVVELRLASLSLCRSGVHGDFA